MNRFNTPNIDEAARASMGRDRREVHIRAWGINGATSEASFHIHEVAQSKAGALPRGGGEARRRKEGSYTPTGSYKRSKHHPLGGGNGKTETATLVVVNLQEQLTLDRRPRGRGRDERQG